MPSALVLQVDDQGNLLYVFPELQRTGGAAQVGRQQYPSPLLGVVFIRVCGRLAFATPQARPQLPCPHHRGSRPRHPCAECTTILNGQMVIRLE